MKKSSVLRVIPVVPWIVFNGPVMIRHVATGGAEGNDSLFRVRRSQDDVELEAGPLEFHLDAVECP